MKYLDKPTPSNYNVHYKGLYSSLTLGGRGSYRARQIFQHPYIAVPSISENGDTLWNTTCFASFTDGIRKSFHDLNFTVLAMELLEWSSYYSINNSNPYNQPNYLHFGMPKEFSLAYQATQNRDTEGCGIRVKGLFQNRIARNYSNQNCKDRIAIVEHCQKLSCIWKNDCHLFKNYSSSLVKVLDKDWTFQIESVLGSIIEHFTSTEEGTKEMTPEMVLHEDYGCFLDDKWDEVEGVERENILQDWEDAINYLVMSTCDITNFDSILKEMNYWPKDIAKVEEKAIPVDEDITGNDEEIKRAMLRWVTERSM